MRNHPVVCSPPGVPLPFRTAELVVMLDAAEVVAVGAAARAARGIASARIVSSERAAAFGIGRLQGEEPSVNYHVARRLWPTCAFAGSRFARAGSCPAFTGRAGARPPGATSPRSGRSCPRRRWKMLEDVAARKGALRMADLRARAARAARRPRARARGGAVGPRASADPGPAVAKGKYAGEQRALGGLPLLAYVGARLMNVGAGGTLAASATARRGRWQSSAG